MISVVCKRKTLGNDKAAPEVLLRCRVRKKQMEPPVSRSPANSEKKPHVSKGYRNLPRNCSHMSACRDKGGDSKAWKIHRPRKCILTALPK